MMFAFTLLIKSSLVLSAALLLGRWQRLGAMQRHFLLVLAILTTPLLFLPNLLPNLLLGLEPPAGLEVWAGDIILPTIEIDTSRTSAPISTTAKIAPVVLIYLAVVTLLVLRLLVKWHATKRWIGPTQPLSLNPSLLANMPGLANVQLVISSTQAAPLTYGFIKHTIVVPTEWRDWDTAKQTAALQHELAHVVRRDTLVSGLCSLICCLFWVQPLLWIANRKVRMEAEQSCDDAVVMAGSCPLAYAITLLEVARTQQIGLAANMATTSTVPKRVRALIDPHVRRTKMTPKQYSLSAVFTACLLVSFSSIGAADAQKPVSAPSLESDGPLSLIVKVAPIYPQQASIDGVEGYVVLAFDVSEQGRPVNIRVVEAEPKNVFAEAATEALKLYRYKPLVRDGAPVVVQGVQQRVNFKLEGGSFLEQHPIDPQAAQVSSLTLDLLTEVQELIRNRDYQRAATRLQQHSDSGVELTINERAQIANLRGFIAFSTDDMPGAIEQYKQVLAADAGAIPVGMRITTLYSVAQLHFVIEDYEAALEYISQWMSLAETPGPTPLVFMGQALYQLGRFDEAIERLEEGVREAGERSVTVRENWWALLNYLYFEQERWADVERVLEILNREYPSDKYAERLRAIKQMRAG